MTQPTIDVAKGGTTCQKCGYEAASVECPRCGVVLAKARTSPRPSRTPQRRHRRAAWPVVGALLVALLGPVIVAVGPDGIVHPDEYMPVGLFVVALFSPAFALGVFVLPQYIGYAVAVYLFIQFCLYRIRKQRLGPRAAA